MRSNRIYLPELTLKTPLRASRLCESIIKLIGKKITFDK